MGTDSNNYITFLRQHWSAEVEKQRYKDEKERDHLGHISREVFIY